MEGFTPLHHAVQKGFSELVKLITPASEYEDHVNGIKGDLNNRALHLAAESGHAGILIYLPNMDPDPNIKDSDGSTPLFKATENGHLDAVKTLLRTTRVEINIANNAGTTCSFPHSQEASFMWLNTYLIGKILMSTRQTLKVGQH
jgi:ankyrin repeat protein